MPRNTPQDDLVDASLSDEIEMVSDLVVAAAASDGPMSQAQIDAVLGVKDKGSTGGPKGQATRTVRAS